MEYLLNTRPQAISERTSYHGVLLVFRSYSQVISRFFNIYEFGPSLCVTTTSTCSRVDHLRFGSIARDSVALFALGFPSPPPQNGLGWPRTITRRLIMQKASGHRLQSAA